MPFTWIDAVSILFSAISITLIILLVIDGRKRAKWHFNCNQICGRIAKKYKCGDMLLPPDYEQTVYNCDLHREELMFIEQGAMQWRRIFTSLDGRDVRFSSWIKGVYDDDRW